MANLGFVICRTKLVALSGCKSSSQNFKSPTLFGVKVLSQAAHLGGDGKPVSARFIKGRPKKNHPLRQKPGTLLQFSPQSLKTLPQFPCKSGFKPGGCMTQEGLVKKP
jgi:hypothetical protein